MRKVVPSIEAASSQEPVASSITKTTMKNKEAFTGYNSKMKETARSLRKNMTRQEKHLWYDFLRDYPVKWYRQRSVDRFIVDFFCFKARLVIDQVRGKDVKVALGLLRNINRAASEPVSKVIKSAAANAINNFGFDEDRLYVAEIYANDGLKMRRYLPRAKGSASGLVKRNCHITVVVKMR